MNLKDLAGEIISGRRLSRADELGFFCTAEIEELSSGADMIRSALCGDHVDLCAIINGRSGRCSEDCRFCAQSARYCTNIREYDFADEEEIFRECSYVSVKGVHHFAIVTAGRALKGTEFEKALEVFRKLRTEFSTGLCASFGFLTDEQFRQLKEAGVSRIHCNIETSERNFPNICTTHTFADKIDCIKRAMSAGFEVCSGGIIGMGETWEDRLDMALCLSELGVCSVPINVLTPIKGTPFADVPTLSEEEILRTAAMFRYIMPTMYIRLAAGRGLMENSGRRGFCSGVNAAITGDMLTTTGSSIQSDIDMLASMGFDI